MKMKKALSIILGGAVLVGSSSFIFADNSIQLSTQTQEQSAITSEFSLENTQIPTVTVEVLAEIVNDEELEQEILELIEEILDELEEESEVDETEVDEDEEVEVDEEVDADETTNEENQLVLENLYRNLLKYQLVYDRVPAQAKPAIEKNMKNMQLKIVHHMIKMNADLNILIPEINVEEVQKELSILKEELENNELTEEAKQELINSISALEKKISNHEEMGKLVEFIKENENWEKELKNNIHQEFKTEKAKVHTESKITKEEIKQAKEKLKKSKKEVKESKKELEEQMKTNTKADTNIKKAVEINETIENKIEIKNDNKKANEKSEKKDKPVKQNNSVKGNGTNK